MHRWSGLLLAVVVPALAFACGGKTSNDGNDGGQQGSSGVGGAGSGGGSGAGSGASSGAVSGAGSGGSSGGAPRDAEPADDAPIVVVDAQAPMNCMSNGMSGSGGQGSCELATSEICRDGTTYSVTCQCPEAMCYCTQSAPNGSGSGAGFSYSGCPSCSVTDGLYTLCGFPQ